MQGLHHSRNRQLPSITEPDPQRRLLELPQLGERHRPRGLYPRIVRLDLEGRTGRKQRARTRQRRDSRHRYQRLLSRHRDHRVSLLAILGCNLDMSLYRDGLPQLLNGNPVEPGRTIARFWSDFPRSACWAAAAVQTRAIFDRSPRRVRRTDHGLRGPTPPGRALQVITPRGSDTIGSHSCQATCPDRG